MKWIPGLTRRNVFISFTLLFLLYLLYILNNCLIDRKQVTLNYFIFRDQSHYEIATKHLAALFNIIGSTDRKKYSPKRKQNLVPEKRLPDALIIGVKKCGTRALLEFLRLHPDVRAAGSEIHFFDRYYDLGYEWYRKRMPSTLEGQITMEKTPSYWVTKTAPERVYAMNPSIKLLAVVRDPVTRAISDYAQSASKRPFLPPFEDLCIVSYRGSPEISSSWAPVRVGVYARPLKRWLRVFPRDSLLLVSGEGLVAHPAAEMAKVQDFLGLKRVITEKHFYLNSSKGFPCILRPSGRQRCLGKNKGRRHPDIDEAVIERLRRFYTPHNEEFYELAGLDFGWP